MPRVSTVPGTAELEASPDTVFQRHLLQGVARTFALTIPRLPDDLVDPVGNAYLLCRIADTIEDQAGLAPAEKRFLSRQFIDVVAGRAPAAGFAQRFASMLDEARPPAERILIEQTPRVVDILRGFKPAQQRAIERCVAVMARGMAYYQARASRAGLADWAEFDNYCYHVAGVVGELLTGLYCDYHPAIAERRERLMALAASFGQGLQMVNILKDIHEDFERGVCWLPRPVFANAGFELKTLDQGYEPAFADGLEAMLAAAHGHLRNALDYTLALPAAETGLRTFCLWAVGLALLTLRRIRRQPDFSSGRQVRVGKGALLATVATTAVARRHDRLLQGLFARLAAGLPLAAAVSTHTGHEAVRRWFEDGAGPEAQGSSTGAAGVQPSD